MNKAIKSLKRERGQALVESAIILPMFIFMLLGILQMGLIYQARYLLKYAAYRAVRTGALLNANHEAMKQSAMAVLAPIMGLGDAYSKIDGFTSYEAKMIALKTISFLGDMASISLLDVVICGPTMKHFQESSSEGYKTAWTDGKEIDFDAPENVLWDNSKAKSGSWGYSLNQFERTKLRIQLQYYHQLVIPFANMVIFKAWAGMNQLRELRMQGTYYNTTGISVPGEAPQLTRLDDKGNGNRHVNKNKNALAMLALATKKVFLPMHANYAFRMQSNLYPKSDEYKIPDDNRCWHYKSGDEGVL
jgi:hypothetical protein